MMIRAATPDKRPPPLDIAAPRDAKGNPLVHPRDQLAAAMEQVAPKRVADPTYKRGTELCNADRVKALREYVHRYTKDHRPAWAKSRTIVPGAIYAVQFASDREWLDNTDFPVNAKGRLIDAPCISWPTWPDGITSREEYW